MTVTSLMRTPASLVWLVLSGLTVVSWILAADHGLSERHFAASLLIFVVAVFKVRLVGLYFMELKHAPTELRAAFEGYCAVLLLLLAGMYIFG